MNEETLKSKFAFYNPWWREKRVSTDLSLPYKRKAFLNILDYLVLDRVIIIKGPRRTGKSTLMYQVINDLIDKKINPERIIYLNFEDTLLRENLHSLLTLFEKLSIESLESKETKYIFLDEVHLLPNWALVVKALFDKKYNLKFICSGSAASLIQKSGESLAGRTVEEVIFPFSFKEFVDFHISLSTTKLEITRKNYFLFKKDLDLYWELYLRQGGFAHLLNVNKPDLIHKLVYEDIIQKVIYKDLVDLYNIREPMILEKVFYYLIQTSGQILNESNLSRTLGLNRETLRNYLAYLRRAFLYIELSKFSRSIKQILGSNPKIHVIDPVLFTLTPQVNNSFIWESTIAQFLLQKYGNNLYYWRDREEVDFVVQKGKDLLPIEVKSGQNVVKKDIKGMFKFFKRFNVKEGWVVYGGEDKEEIIGDIKIRHLYAPKLLYFET